MTMMTLEERAQHLLRTRTPFVRATVVRAQQPSSAHAGDEAILLPDGTIEGFVGGQCAQSSVRKAALAVLQTNESMLLRVLPDGEVHFPESPGACVVVNPCLSGGALEIYLAPHVPAPLVQIRGATPIADKLTEMCGVLGFEVDRDESGDLTQATAVVIASHGGPEAEMIRAALDARVRYIGLVASKVRGAAILDSLALSEDERARVHTPVGLPIGARTPAEIAVAILAELIQEIRVRGLAVAQTTDVAEAVDPMCGMTVTVSRGTEHVRVDEKDYWFCSPTCRASFRSMREGT